MASAEDWEGDRLPDGGRIVSDPMAEGGDGPTALSNDSWYTGPEDGWGNEAYQGRRRVEPPGARRRWIVVTLVLAGLGTAVGVPLVLMAANNDSPTASPTQIEHSQTEQGIPDPTASPFITPAPSSPAPTPTKASITRVTYEAEAAGNLLTGSAQERSNRDASGDSIVRNIGNWNNTPGTLTFTKVTARAPGTYTLTVYYAFLNNDRSRSAIITVNQAAPINVSFNRPSGCCSSNIRIPIRLNQGINAITFANPTDHAPHIDKIVIG